jgi:multiple antibiotic resistance protein
MNSFVERLLKDVIFMTMILNPLVKVTIVLTLAEIYKKRQVIKSSVRAILTGLLILLVFGFTGSFIFKIIFQVDINAILFVGGLIFFKTGYDQTEKGIRFALDKTKSIRELTIVPITIPLTVGPGPIAKTMLLFQESGPLYASLSVVIALFFNFILMFIFSFVSHSLKNEYFGAIIKVIGFIVMIMGVNMMFEAIRSFFFN